MISALRDLGRIIWLADDSFAPYLASGYRWDRLVMVVAGIAAVGTAGSSLRFQDQMPLTNLSFEAGAGAFRYVGTAMQTAVLFSLALLFLVAGTSEATRFGVRSLGFAVDRQVLCGAIAIATCPIAARGLVVGIATMAGATGFPTMPWTLVDPTPAWSAVLLTAALRRGLPDSIRYGLGAAVLVLGYLGLAWLGSNLE